MTPVIGVPFMGTGFHRYMQNKYTQCLERAGAEVRILKPTADPEQARRYLAECDGFLFPGGADIAPALYGQKRRPECGKPDRIRDGFERLFLRAALKTGKPVLCICRGMQLLNVVRGGTLLQDIKPLQTYRHADALHRAGFTHPVRLQTGSLVAQIFGTGVISVNSLHHQAVDKLGKGLCAAAKSPDGFIEAIELRTGGFTGGLAGGPACEPTRDPAGEPTCEPTGNPAGSPAVESAGKPIDGSTGKPFVLGVQWHPEHMAAKDASQQKLFERFVSECRA